MHKIKLFPTLVMAAIIAVCSATAPKAGFAEVNVQIYGYLPAPPGVHVYLAEGRPYYVEKHRRVYMERDRKHHGDNGRHGHGYREHEDHGHKGHGR